MKKNNEYSDADNFEIMVSQIATLLEGDNAEVTWNERIVDPGIMVKNVMMEMVLTY